MGIRTKIAILFASACAWVAWGGVGWGAITLLGIAQDSCSKALTCCCAQLIFRRLGQSHGWMGYWRSQPAHAMHATLKMFSAI